MNLRNEIVLFLKDLQQDNKTLQVKWDAGGDEAILKYFVDGEEQDYNNDLLYRDLTDHLIIDLSLPTAGEYFNHGRGEIYLGFNDQPCIRYDEFAYEFDYEDVFDFKEKHGIKPRITFETDVHSQAYLDLMGANSTSFSVPVRLFHERIVKYFEKKLYTPSTDYYSEEKQFLRQQIVEGATDKVLNGLRGDSKGLLLSFELVIDKNETRVEDVDVKRIVPDKDNVAHEVLLF